MFGQDRLNQNDGQVKAALKIIHWLLLLLVAIAPLLVRNR